MSGRGCAGWRGVKGGKWDNCNSIINKIYFKKEIVFLIPESSFSAGPFSSIYKYVLVSLRQTKVNTSLSNSNHSLLFYLSSFCQT